MWPFDRLKVRLKLVLLTGVPVLGALLLSALIARDAQQRAQTADSLGSIEDLAQLTERMTLVIHQLQRERARQAYGLGIKEQDGNAVARQHGKTDRALQSLERFLFGRDESKLPAKLRQDLKGARDRLRGLAAHRQRIRDGLPIEATLAFYAAINDSLIGATAAVTELTDDGELLRTIFRLVAAMQVIERSSREHALLSYVFATAEFPPGTYRDFVTLLTEQAAYTASIRVLCSQQDFERIQAALKGPFASKIADMRKTALETTEEELAVDARAWFEAQDSNMQQLFGIEQQMGTAVRTAALHKMLETRHAVRVSVGLAGTVLMISGLLGWGIARGLTRSVHVLSEAATAVHTKGDFRIRARKTSTDEIGLLTDAFNGMLSGIEARDRELQAHRENLEAQVEARTRELFTRNAQMRVVLDNVEQGLVMLDREGRISGECSRAFSQAFGAPEAGRRFHEVLAEGDDKAGFELEAGYGQLVADVLPLELALDQMPKSLERGGQKFALSFTPVGDDGRIDGALLMVRDVTAEVEARRSDEVRRERIRVFESIMRDRSGFLEFLAESRSLLERICDPAAGDPSEKLRAIHTLKGNTAVFGVTSVSEAAHELEGALLESEELATRAQSALSLVWDAFLSQVNPILAQERVSGMEVSEAELEQLLGLLRARAAHSQIERCLLRLRGEPARLRLQRVKEQLVAVARRVGKPEPNVLIHADEIRIPIPPFRSFWSAFTHVIRNTADHGLETEAERAAGGKLPRNQVDLRIISNREALVVEISDDGHGIDWSRLATKAEQANLPHQTRDDLIHALFSAGISTAEAVTQVSGRGIGMSALLASCTAIGGRVEVESEPGRGARFRFSFPSIENDPPPSSVLPLPHSVASTLPHHHETR
jgi:two-component system, chemotaxis family, sensor kinase CheA